MQTSRLDVQLKEMGVDFLALEEGLPRKPHPKPTLPVLAKINGAVAFCMMAERSILTGKNLPTNFHSLETFGSDRQRSLSKSLNLEKMTLLCRQIHVYLDERLLESEYMTLPVGDKTHYIRVATQDIVNLLGDMVEITRFPELAITPDDLLDGSDFSRARVRQAMNDMTSIPPFPVTARAIIELSMKQDFGIEKLIDIVEHDAPIASNLLSWANSAIATQGRFEIRSVHDAIVRLGTRSTMDFALQASMMKSFKTSKELAPIVQFASYNSLHSAYGAKMTAEMSGSSSSADAYLAGLMYNLGELLMVQCFPERSHDYLIMQEINPHLSREVLSREVFKVSFASSTDLLMDAWKMPSSVADASRALASFQDQGQNEIAADIRLWQVQMLDAGFMPYAHAPFGWDQLGHFPLGKDVVEKSRKKISEFLNFSTTVAQGVR